MLADPKTDTETASKDTPTDLFSLVKKTVANLFPGADSYEAEGTPAEFNAVQLAMVSRVNARIRYLVQYFWWKVLSLNPNDASHVSLSRMYDPLLFALAQMDSELAAQEHLEEGVDYKFLRPFRLFLDLYRDKRFQQGKIPAHCFLVTPAEVPSFEGDFRVVVIINSKIKLTFSNYWGASFAEIFQGITAETIIFDPYHPQGEKIFRGHENEAWQRSIDDRMNTFLLRTNMVMVPVTGPSKAKNLEPLQANLRHVAFQIVIPAFLNELNAADGQHQQFLLKKLNNEIKQLISTGQLSSERCGQLITALRERTDLDPSEVDILEFELATRFQLSPDAPRFGEALEKHKEIKELAKRCYESYSNLNVRTDSGGNASDQKALDVVRGLKGSHRKNKFKINQLKGNFKDPETAKRVLETGSGIQSALRKIIDSGPCWLSAEESQALKYFKYSKDGAMVSFCDTHIDPFLKNYIHAPKVVGKKPDLQSSRGHASSDHKSDKDNKANKKDNQVPLPSDELPPIKQRLAKIEEFFAKLDGIEAFFKQHQHTTEVVAGLSVIDDTLTARYLQFIQDDDRNHLDICQSWNCMNSLARGNCDLLKQKIAVLQSTAAKEALDEIRVGLTDLEGRIAGDQELLQQKAAVWKAFARSEKSKDNQESKQDDLVKDAEQTRSSSVDAESKRANQPGKKPQPSVKKAPDRRLGADKSYYRQYRGGEWRYSQSRKSQHTLTSFLPPGAQTTTPSSLSPPQTKEKKVETQLIVPHPQFDVKIAGNNLVCTYLHNQTKQPLVQVVFPLQSIESIQTQYRAGSLPEEVEGKNCEVTIDFSTFTVSYDGVYAGRWLLAQMNFSKEVFLALQPSAQGWKEVLQKILNFILESPAANIKNLSQGLVKSSLPVWRFHKGIFDSTTIMEVGSSFSRGYLGPGFFSVAPSAGDLIATMLTRHMMNRSLPAFPTQRVLLAPTPDVGVTDIPADVNNGNTRAVHP